MKKLLILLFILTTFLFLTSCDNEDQSENENEYKRIEEAYLYFTDDQLNALSLNEEKIIDIWESSAKIDFGKYKIIVCENGEEKTPLIYLADENSYVKKAGIYKSKSVTVDEAKSIRIGMDIWHVLDVLGAPVAYYNENRSLLYNDSFAFAVYFDNDMKVSSVIIPSVQLGDIATFDGTNDESSASGEYKRISTSYIYIKDAQIEQTGLSEQELQEIYSSGNTVSILNVKIIENKNGESVFLFLNDAREVVSLEKHTVKEDLEKNVEDITAGASLSDVLSKWGAPSDYGSNNVIYYKNSSEKDKNIKITLNDDLSVKEIVKVNDIGFLPA